MKTPPAEEWDFRRVHPSALSDAADWEYARTCEPVRKDVVAWLQSKLKGSTVNNLLRRGKPPSRVSMLPWQVQQQGHLASRNLTLFHLVTELRDDFPAPWLARDISYKRNPKFSRLRISPAARLVREAVKFGPGFEHCVTSAFMLRIDWHEANVADVVRDFERWARKEASLHPERKRAGKRSQKPIEPLKWLAALRLKNAGVTYEDAYSLLAKMEDPEHRLPLYYDPAEHRLNGNGYEHLYRFVKCQPSEAWTDTCAVRIPRSGVRGSRYLPENLMTTWLCRAQPPDAARAGTQHMIPYNQIGHPIELTEDLWH